MGNIEIVCGPMSSGKTSELIRTLTRYIIADKNILIFKSKLDTRDGAELKSRTGAHVDSIYLINDPKEILQIYHKINKTVHAIAIDEAQFLNKRIIPIVQTLAYKHNIDVIISGLEKDYKGNPFGPMPQLLAIADNVKKLTAVCMKCKQNSAQFTYKKKQGNDLQIEVGGDDLYEARCGTCWQM